MKRATSFSMDRDTTAVLIGQVTLTFSDRFRRRIRLTMDGGEPFMLDLAEVTQLRDGGFLNVYPGSGQGKDQCEGQIAVCAAVEDVLEAATDDPGQLVRWAWHLGNRHLPVQFLETTGLRLAWDPVIADMLRGLGAEPQRQQARFAPEGGAYGGGPTYGHSHGHEHSHDHGHSHSHEHSRDDGHQTGRDSHGQGTSGTAGGSTFGR